MGTRTLLVLTGSAVDSFHVDLSRIYASGFVEAIADPDRYRIHIASVTPDRLWRITDSLDAHTVDSAPALTLPDALARIVDLGVEVMVPQMFCLPGMTTYRAVFDALGIAYVGNRPEVMALTADKVRTRAVVSAAGVPVPEAVTAHDAPLPVVVKPADSDNSMGITLVRDAAALDAAIEEARRYSSEVLIERYVELGREVRCGIVVDNGVPVPLPLEEYPVDTESAPIRTREDKLGRRTDGGLYLAAKGPGAAWIVDPADPITAPVQRAALLAHRAIGARHHSLFDFRVDPNGVPFLIEAGPYCSYARSSVVATMAAAAGIDTPELFEMALRELDRSPNADGTPRTDGTPSTDDTARIDAPEVPA